MKTNPSTPQHSSSKLRTTYAPTNGMKYKVQNLEQAMKSDTPSIGSLKRTQGENFTKNLLLHWLIYLNEILNLRRPMNEDQLKLASEMILSEFYALKMADLTLLFKKIIGGVYGEFYESLTIPKLIGFFRQYFDDRCNLAMEQSQRDHLEHKREI